MASDVAGDRYDSAIAQAFDPGRWPGPEHSDRQRPNDELESALFFSVSDDDGSPVWGPQANKPVSSATEGSTATGGEPG